MSINPGRYLSDTHLAAGQSLGHYQLVQRLDKRRRIEVWYAQHISLHVPAALKILLLTSHAEDEYRREEQLLQNEARFLVNLHHPYIVGYRDYLVGRDYRALILEYARRGSIVQHHGSGRKLPLFLIHQYIKQIGCALFAMHQRGQIHRDVKPSNILLLSQHHAVLADFGLAINDPEIGYGRKRYTGGTAPYMAPEQYRGAPGVASDQYSLAICVYEWLTGHRPFSGETERMMHRREHLSPRSVRIERPELPIAVDKILRTALNPDAERRYPTVMDFVHNFVEATRSARPPLIRRLPYYRSQSFRSVTGYREEPSSSWPQLRETGEQAVVRLPALPRVCQGLNGM